MAAYFVKIEFKIGKTPYKDSAIITFKKGETITEESFISKIQEKRGIVNLQITDITKL